MRHRLGLVPLIGLALVIPVVLTGCKVGVNSSESAPTPSPTSTASSTPTPETSDETLAKTVSTHVKEWKATPVSCTAVSDALKKIDGLSMGNQAKLAILSERYDICLENSAGVENADGTIEQLPLYFGDGGTPVVFDTTDNPNTPPLLDGDLMNQNVTTSWAEFVKRADNQQWYIDGVNARTSETGFDWADVLKFAAQKGYESRVIQVFDYTVEEMSDAQVREAVRPYMGNAADTLQIVRIFGAIIDTLNAGTDDHPQMANFAHEEKMIRVSLVPIMFDDKGKPIALDVSRGAGIFIDCGNLHWIPPKVWVCADSYCHPPVCPPNWTGTWPVCKDPWSNDPSNTILPPWGTGLNPGIYGPAGNPAAGDPPAVYVPPGVVTVADPPTGSDPDDVPPPTKIEGDVPATEEAPATTCVEAFGVRTCS
jgi:hypothetical protein